MSRRVPLLILLALLVSSCDNASTGTFATTTTVPAASTVATTTTVPAASTVATTTTAPATSTVATTTTAPSTTTSRSGPTAVASGSGCAPSGDTLPDGEWFGFVEGIDAGLAIITFDLSCYFDGAEADLAAAEDGHPLPLEFYPYIRNRNPKVFDLVVSAGALVEDIFMGTVPFGTWAAGVAPDSGCSAATGYGACPVWVRITGGEAVSLYGMLPEWAGDGRGS